MEVNFGYLSKDSIDEIILGLTKRIESFKYYYDKFEYDIRDENIDYDVIKILEKISDSFKGCSLYSNWSTTLSALYNKENK